MVAHDQFSLEENPQKSKDFEFKVDLSKSGLFAAGSFIGKQRKPTPPALF